MFSKFFTYQKIHKFDNKLNLQQTPYVQLQIVPKSENFTPSEILWIVTFCKSGPEDIQ